jgi:ATP-dependent Clp protease ATP-binding subunit ClpC
MMTGIPISRVAQSESEKLLSMAPVLKEKVIGQDESIEILARAICRTRAGLKDPKRPIGSFLFLGPTGVGKTYLAKVLAEYLFDDENALIRIDMSEFMEKFAVSRMTGAPPGYVGYEEGGQLTEKVRRRPYSVVLLDEIEKAHPDVFNILLQILDDGHLTDGLGRRVDFKNTILIMTSNLGTRSVRKGGFGFGQSSDDVDYETIKSVILDETRRLFNPEFLNRIDEMVVFRPLRREHVFKIVDLTLDEMLHELHERNIQVYLTDSAREFLVDKGFDPVYGARQVRRMLRKYIEDPIAEELLKKKIRDNSQVLARLAGESLEFVEVDPTRAPEKKKADQRKQMKPHDSP